MRVRIRVKVRLHPWDITPSMGVRVRVKVRLYMDIHGMLHLRQESEPQLVY